MRILIVVMILLCCNIALAAEIVEKGSGLTRGSIAYTFEYDPEDTSSMTINGMRQSDVIRVITGKGKTGLDEKFELYFKSRIGNEWDYEIIKGQKNLKIAVGEQDAFDVNGDGELDMVIELVEVDPVRKATMKIYPNGIVEEIVEEREEEAEENTEEAVEEEETLTGSEPELPVEETETIQEESEEALIPEEKNVPVLPILISVLVLGLIVLGVFLLFKFDGGGDEGDDKYIPLEDMHEPGAESHTMVRRTPRMKRGR